MHAIIVALRTCVKAISNVLKNGYGIGKQEQMAEAQREAKERASAQAQELAAVQDRAAALAEECSGLQQRLAMADCDRHMLIEADRVMTCPGNPNYASCHVQGSKQRPSCLTVSAK